LVVARTLHSESVIFSFLFGNGKSLLSNVGQAGHVRTGRGKSLPELLPLVFAKVLIYAQEPDYEDPKLVIGIVALVIIAYQLQYLGFGLFGDIFFQLEEVYRYVRLVGKRK